MKNSIKYICAVLMVLGVSVNVWATDETLNFDKCDWGFSTSSYSYGPYSADGYAIQAFSAKGHYYNSTYYGVQLNYVSSGDHNAWGYIVLPSFPGTISAIKVYTHDGAGSNNQTVDLYVNGVKQTSQTMCGDTYTTPASFTGLSIATGSTVEIRNSGTNQLAHIKKIVVTHDGSSISSAGAYAIMVDPGSYDGCLGTVSYPKSAIPGTTVTLTPSPNSGCIFSYWNAYYTPNCGSEKSLSMSGNTFTMPYGDVYVEAIFQEATCTEDLSTPTGLSATFSSATTATFSWNAVSNASSYIISIEGDDSYYEVIDGLTTTSYTATDLSDGLGAYYELTVQAVGDGITYCNSADASDIFQACSTELSAPTGLTANNHYNNTYGRIQLSWTAVSYASGYEVVLTNESTSQSQTISRTSAQLSVTSNSTMPAGSYTWTVKAIGDHSTYCDSEEANGSFCIGADLSSTTPSGLSVIATAADAVQVSWNAVSNAGKYYLTFTNVATSASSSTNTSNTYKNVNTVPLGKEFRVDLYAKNTCLDVNQSLTASTTFTLYNVTFNMQGYGDAIAPMGAVNGQKITAPSVPTTTHYTFGGWYKESACTNAWNFSSDVVNANTELFALWIEKDYTIYFDANGGSGSMSNVVQAYNSSYALPSSSFVPPAGKAFDCWMEGSSSGTERAVGYSHTVTGDITFYAKWRDASYKDYVFACVDISVASAAAGKALVTSRKDVNVMATNPIKVTITGAVSGHRVSFSNSVGLHFYKKVEGTGADAGKYKYVEATGENSFVTPLTNQEVYVSYNPTSDGTGAVLSALPFTISCDGESQEFNTGGEYVKARNLPASIVIAAKTNGIYSALPANMGATGVNPKPVIVNVATNGGVLTVSGPSTLGYKLWPVKTVVSTGDRFGTATSTGFPAALYGDRLRFAGVDNHGLWANDSKTENKIKNDAQITAISDGGESAYEWKVTTTEEDGQFVYTLQTDQTNNDYYLRLWGSKWGTYSAGNEKLYLLPLSPVTQAAIEVFEWGTDEIAVRYPNKADCTAMTAKIGDGDPTTVTISDLGGDIYKLTGVGTLTSNAAKLLTLTTTESGNSKQALFIIPYIISSGTGTPTTMRAATGDNTSNSITRGVEVVVRSGAKFEVDASSKLMASDMYVYPGGEFEIASGRELSVSGLYLRGGHSWLGSSFAMPHAKINASIDGLAHGSGLNYDYYIDATKYYDLAVPITMTWEPVTDETGNENFTYWVKQYNGETRASTGKGWEWYDWSGASSTWAINMGRGYLVAAQPPTGRSYFIMRFPLPMTLPDDESSKDPIPVTAYGMTGGKLNPGVSANNAGWNLIANPFLTAYMKDADGVDDKGVAISGSIKTGSLEPEYKDGKPTGKYVWDETDGKKIRYVTTYDYSTEKYTQHAMSSTVLEPFTGFFIQVAEDCYVKFDPTGRQNDIIARRALKDNLPDDMEIGITASIGEQSDETIILLCDELSRDNALEFPDESSKIMNAGQLNFYTFAGTTSMYANGMTYAEGQEWNAAGLTATVDGEYTFSASKVNTDYVKAVLLKDMNTNTEYDLLSEDVTLFVEKGTVDGRFAIKIVLKSDEETPTVLDVLNEEGVNRGPEKFIYNDKLYIRYNGIIFDAVGKKVSEIK